MKNQIVKLIEEYLTNGGLFNPEHMDPDKVLELLLDCRDEIIRLEEYEWIYKDLSK